MPEGVELSASAARPGDRVILSGSIGEHGMAILSEREGLEFETALQSDSAALHTLVAAMLASSSAAELTTAGAEELPLAAEATLEQGGPFSAATSAIIASCSNWAYNTFQGRWIQSSC